MKPILLCSALLCLLLFNCQPKNKFEDGVKTIYFPGTDNIKQTVEFKNGKKNGRFIEYFPDGKLKARQYYSNDTLDDTTLIYHPDGKLQTIHIYKNKIKHGCWRDYNREGKLISEIFFKNGFLDSVCSKYAVRSGRLLKRIRYIEGLQHGPEEHFHDNGKKKSIQYYFRGEIGMGTEEWNEKGEKIDNDYKIFVNEKDAVMLENTLTYTIRLENPKPTDKVSRMLTPPDGQQVGYMSALQKEGDNFIYKYFVPKGGFVMDNVTIAAFRKTNYGNTVIKTQSFNVASNNF